MRTNPTTWPRATADLLRRFAQARTGISSVEFAILVPFVMLPLYGGTVELNQALTVSRKIDQIGHSIVDLISRQKSFTSSEVGTILSGSSALLLPYDTSTVKVLLTVNNVTSTKQTVAWSFALNDTQLGVGAAPQLTIPSTIITPGVQVIAVRIKYNYTSPFTNVLEHVTGVDAYQFNREYLRYPRLSDTIILSDSSSSQFNADTSGTSGTTSGSDTTSGSTSTSTGSGSSNTGSSNTGSSNTGSSNTGSSSNSWNWGWFWSWFW